MKVLFAAAILALASTSASAVTVNRNSEGLITSVDDLIANNEIYSVDLSDGRMCAEVFSGCNEASDFLFQDEARAVSASEALFSTIYVGDYGYGSGIIEGLDGQYPLVLVPYGIEPKSYGFEVATAVLEPGGYFDGVFTASVTNNTMIYNEQRFAVFSKTGELTPVPSPSPVPLPATAPLLLAALGLAGWRLRKSSK